MEEKLLNEEIITTDTTEEALNILNEIRKQTTTLPDITLDEINNEIKKSRNERKQIKES